MSDLRQVCFSLPVLFDAVVARFELDSTKAQQDFGWKEPARLTETANVGRIVWVPGDEAGSAGELRAARKTRPAGDDSRSLATLGELFHVRIEAADPQFPENERSQYIITRKLYDAWLRAVYLAAHGTFRVLSLNWNLDKNERRHGAELICVCEIEAKIPDAPFTLAPDDTEAEITTSLDDVDEVTTTATP